MALKMVQQERKVDVFVLKNCELGTGTRVQFSSTIALTLKWREGVHPAEVFQRAMNCRIHFTSGLF